MFQVNAPRKQAGFTLLISDQTDFKQKLVRKNKRGHWLRKKNLSREYNILNLYAPNTGAHDFIQQM